MSIYNSDLHYHSPYAAACAKNISIPILAREAKKKGLNLLTSADILHSKWYEHVKENLVKDKDGTFFFKEDKDLPENKRTNFLLGCEVETVMRVHHLLYFKDFEHVDLFKIEFNKYKKGPEKYGDGRPRIPIDAEQLIDICKELDVPIGPAHAFTPYFGVYSHFDTLKEAYGKNYKYIKFIELGLSADSRIANKIPDLSGINFFSFSDSHSPMSYRIGREYVAMNLDAPNFDSFLNLLNKKKENKIEYNVGFNPNEGKYNRTACRVCSQIHSIDQAEKNNWRCIKCKGIVKKGVADRVIEIARLQGNKELKDIDKRPEYKYLIPLAQVIQLALKEKNIDSKNVIEKYELFIKENTEIGVMLNLSEDELNRIDKEITKYILAFRKDLVVFKPGGAGFYGVPFICFSEQEKIKKQKEIDEETKIKIEQKTLF